MVFSGSARHSLDSAITRAGEALFASFDAVCCSQGGKCDRARRACCSNQQGAHAELQEAQELSFVAEDWALPRGAGRLASGSRPLSGSRPPSPGAAERGAHRPVAYGRPCSQDVESPLDAAAVAAACAGGRHRRPSSSDSGRGFEAVSEQLKGITELIHEIGGSSAGRPALRGHRLDSLDELEDQQVVGQSEDCGPEPTALQVRRTWMNDVAPLAPIGLCFMAQAAVVGTCREAKATEPLRHLARGFNTCAEGVCADVDQALLTHCVQPRRVADGGLMAPALYPPQAEPRTVSRSWPAELVPRSWRDAPATASSSRAPAAVGPPAASHVLGLRETLQFLCIASYHAPAVHWCNEMGAASLREVAEHVEEFGSALKLRPLELQRVRRWAKEELAKDARLQHPLAGLEHEKKELTEAARLRRASVSTEHESRVLSAPARGSTARELAKPSRAVPSITIASAAGLKACDWNGKSDPYCKCWIQGQPDSEFKTQVFKRELSPAWNHWRALPDLPEVCALQFEVWDWDRLTKDDFIGKAGLRVRREAGGPPEQRQEPAQLEACEVELPLRGGDDGEGASGLLLIHLAGLRPASHSSALLLPADWASAVDGRGLPFRYRSCKSPADASLRQAPSAPTENATAPRGGDSSEGAERAQKHSPRRSVYQDKNPPWLEEGSFAGTAERRHSSQRPLSAR